MDELSFNDLQIVSQEAEQLEKAHDLANSLRRLADIVVSQPEHVANWIAFLEDQFHYFALTRTEFLEFVAMLTPHSRKTLAGDRGITKYFDNGGARQGYADISGYLGVIPFRITTYRDAVCKKVVVGTKTVTRQVIDPNAPTVTVVEEIDDVVWECQPLLGERDAEQ